MKKPTLKMKTVEFKINGIALLINAWVRARHKSRRFNSPVTSYDDTDWHVSIELKIESENEFQCNPTIAGFSSSNSVKDVRDLTNSLNASLETHNKFLTVIRSLKSEVISEAIEWNKKFAKE
jgi:hypothetical protein